MIPLSLAYASFVMAMERVEQRLRRVTRALDDAGVPYAVVGGNAVAAWVARVDPASTRTTKDVDLLVRRADLLGVGLIDEHVRPRCRPTCGRAWRKWSASRSRTS